MTLHVKSLHQKLRQLLYVLLSLPCLHGELANMALILKGAREARLEPMFDACDTAQQ